MTNLMRVGSSVLRYRGGEGQWAWAIHRAAGLGVLAFLAIHIVDIVVVGFGPAPFNALLFLYKGPVARVGEILLAFGLLYHALNGLRITAADFAPALASLRTARTLFYLQVIVFLALFIPASYFMMVTLPQPAFHNNAPVALVVTFGILAIPGIVALGASVIPPALSTRIDSDEAVGAYGDAIALILKGPQPRSMNRTQINIWLFMRISGVLLIGLALFHLFWLHFVVGVEDISFNLIVQRWQSPTVGWFWRSYDLSLLVLAFTHGMLGAWYVIDDYVRRPSIKRLLLQGAVVTWIVLIVMGAWIIFFFNGTLA